MADKKISQLTAAGPLTGTEPLPIVQGGVTVKTTAQDIANLAGGGSYLKYVALLSQSGTNDPVATVLENTLGGEVIWTRDFAGAYVATLANVFIENKTFVLYTHDTYNGTTGFPGAAWGSTSQVYVYFNDTTGSSVDIGDSAIDSIEIRVYP